MMEQKPGWLMPTALGAGILLVIGGAGLYLMRDKTPAPEAAVETPQPTANTTAPPSTRTVETPAPTRTLPLPPLDESDPEVLGGLTELFGQDAVMKHIVPERLVRNIVVTIDNVPRQQLALNQRPVQATPGDFVTAGEENAVVLSPANYERYEPFIALVSNVDAKTLVSFYRGLEPLFQEAYEDLGHPGQSFNARLNEVIEHLLQTPTPRGEIALVQPGVLYKYADERLENLSAGQKLMIRMGVNNATVVKGKLREIQAELL